MTELPESDAAMSFDLNGCRSSRRRGTGSDAPRWLVRCLSEFAFRGVNLTRIESRPLKQQLGIGGSPIGPLTTGGSQVNVTAGNLKSFQVGEARIDDLVVVVADFFAMLSQAVGAKLDGIVGYNFLRNFRVVMDYPSEKFRLE